MSSIGDLIIGTTAVNAQSNALGIVSQNLANSQTVGYKEGTATFADLITQMVPYGGPSNNGNSSALGYSPSGVKAGNNTVNDLQGDVTNTGVATDIAISGTGFLPVSGSSPSGGIVSYTRAGQFNPDSSGDLFNTAGYFLQAWPIDANGNLPSGVTSGNVSSSAAIAALQTVNISGLTEIPVPTSTVTVKTNLTASQTITPTTISVQANLQSTQATYGGPPTYDVTSSTANMASGSVTPQFTTPITLTDSSGTSHNLTVGYLKTGTNSWEFEVYAQPATDVTGVNNGQIAYGNLIFNSDGTLAGLSQTPATSANINWQDGAEPSNVAFNWGTAGQTNGVSQLSTASTNTGVTVQPYDPTKSTADMTSGAVPPQFTDAVTVVDSKGTAHTVNIDYVKTATNTWAVELNAQPATDVTTTNGGQLAAGTVTFNGDGTLASVSPSLTQPVAVNWTDGATASSIAFNWGTAGAPFGTTGATAIGRADGLSQVDSSYTNNVTQNGVQPGNLTGVSINASGQVVASYDNNTTRNVYQIPLVDFIAPNQLESQTGDIFNESGGSGAANFQLPGQNDIGKIDPESLEASNVDIATELTTLIVAQNAYQDGSKLISVSDAMLTTAFQMGTT